MTNSVAFVLELNEEQKDHLVRALTRATHDLEREVWSTPPTATKRESLEREERETAQLFKEVIARCR